VRVALVWAATALLVLVGVASAAWRTVHPSDLGSRSEPVRRRVLEAFGVVDPLAAGRAAEIERFDSRFAAHPRATILHVVPGALFLLLAPLQFAPPLRRRFARLHRWCGRVLLALGVVTACTGFYFGFLMPFGGAGETAAIALFGALFLTALGLAFAAVRRGDVACHRAWMIRAFAVALGVATVRLVGAVLDVLLAPAGWPPSAFFVLTLWTGWSLTVVAGELWIASAKFVVPTESSSRR
jgi:uncharacterized membrane protein